MENVTLDEVDRGLLHALQVDGRASFSRIGEVLGVS
ncbi:MAG: AsnC family protein, partial [Nonomuraea sp.]|nr:AsnC family protein [Nonomuraea sp.]